MTSSKCHSFRYPRAKVELKKIKQNKEQEEVERERMRIYLRTGFLPDSWNGHLSPSAEAKVTVSRIKSRIQTQRMLGEQE